MSDQLIMTDEQRVREVWEPEHIWSLSRGFPADELLWEEDRWAAAWQFTEARLENIRQLREEMMLMNEEIDYYEAISDTPENSQPLHRILARLKTILDKLQRGMKEVKNGNR
jgi:hypothetical protein